MSGIKRFHLNGNAVTELQGAAEMPNPSCKPISSPEHFAALHALALSCATHA